MSHINYKFNEPALIEELKEYIDKTYGEHYSQSKFQTTEVVIDNGDGIGFTRGNIIKYAQRYGRKEGRNRKDLLKVLHYAILMLYVHDKENSFQSSPYEYGPIDELKLFDLNSNFTFDPSTLTISQAPEGSDSTITFGTYNDETERKHY
jgi:hypothetical protein